MVVSMDCIFSIEEPGARVVEIRSAKPRPRKHVLMLSCYARKDGKFERFTELSRTEVIELHTAIGSWLEGTRK